MQSVLDRMSGVSVKAMPDWGGTHCMSTVADNVRHLLSNVISYIGACGLLLVFTDSKIGLQSVKKAVLGVGWCLSVSDLEIQLTKIQSMNH